MRNTVLPLLCLPFLAPLPLYAAPLAEELPVIPHTEQENNEPSRSSALSFQEARSELMAQSPKLAAAQAFESARLLQSEAAKGLGGPSLVLDASASRYRVRGDVDVDDIKQHALDRGGNSASLSGIDPSISSLLNNTANRISSGIPDEIVYDKRGSSSNASLIAIWPVYNGGSTKAVKNLLKARADEAVADTSLTANELSSTLTERYFGTQLARMAAGLHDQSVRTIARYDHTAKRAFEEGLIAKVERLEAQAAFENAKRDAEKAHNDAILAETALRRLLKRNAPVRQTTPIFILTKPIEPVEYFQDLASTNHPGFKKVNAKKHQAEAVHKAGQARYMPNVNLFGAYQTREKGSWVAGVNMSWTLYSQIDRRKMSSASMQQIIQAEQSDEELRENIMLLVEKHWRNVENARNDYIRRGSNVNLAKEVLRLKKAGLREGVNTVADLMKAETEFAKAETERAKAANDYVQSLAKLLESSGVPERLTDYERKADVKLLMKPK
ncbi:TolC family protein [Neisseria canis]|uniref:Type I secretion outer membrane protein, TolC family n=1 Tax=Neisseria canis TaxID=493 RepID=A0A1X3CYA4_9NEIS|nr:TolC family protein [Neisseria canis]OSI12643.1 transporter [Neisseria canis]VEF02743.1 type I secretion outer membrane protein, TolC family [Neisseria canis]